MSRLEEMKVVQVVLRWALALEKKPLGDLLELDLDELEAVEVPQLELQLQVVLGQVELQVLLSPGQRCICLLSAILGSTLLIFGRSRLSCR